MVVYVVFAGHDCEDWGMEAIYASRADAEHFRDELIAEAEEDEDKEFCVSIMERRVR